MAHRKTEDVPSIQNDLGQGAIEQRRKFSVELAREVRTDDAPQEQAKSAKNGSVGPIFLDTPQDQELGDPIEAVLGIEGALPISSHHVTRKRGQEDGSNTIGWTLGLERLASEWVDENVGALPSELSSLFMDRAFSVYVPKKLDAAMKYIGVKRLRAIHKDVNVARELIAIVVSNLADTYQRRSSEGAWKVLNSVILQRQVSASKDNIYRKILDVLLVGTTLKGGIIEVAKGYAPGIHSKRYRLTDNYLGHGVVLKVLRTDYARSIRKKAFKRMLEESMEDVICRNCIRAYDMMEFPSKAEMIAEGKKMVHEKKSNRKGLRYTMRNKNALTHWKTPETRRIIEEDIELFERLTAHGLLIPTVSHERAGHRVVDSITLMPSWIRRMIKLRGKLMVECDYAALHPNIASTIFGGSRRAITHEKVAVATGLTKDDVKIEHLSFFNKPLVQMKASKLFTYYSEEEPEMMKGILASRDSSGMPYKEKHKATSQALFTVEVQMMTEVVARLNAQGIYVLYIYDAVATIAKHHSTVMQTMNDVAEMFSVNTVAK